MCGITGLINCGNENILKIMNSEISHRGPDDEGIKWFNEKGSGLAHKRLSIIDLSSAGHQPMCSDDEMLWIIFNGEIYNYISIRNTLINLGYSFKSKSDTEVILKAYQHWGENCLEKFNGIFAFAIYDAGKHSFFAARDRLGVKPFYYTKNNDKFIFASEIKAIIKTGLCKVEPDYYALHTPTRFQISPFTGFKDIFKLPAGHFLFFNNSELTIKEYWNINPVELSTDINSEIEELEHLLIDSIKLQMVSDVPVGVLLSGGLDSSIISALMRKNFNNDISAFTVRFSNEDLKFEKTEDDYKYASIVAQKFGFKHEVILLEPKIENLIEKITWHLDEPLSDPAAINTFLISEVARKKGINVLLNGMGGDEVFGGYRKHLACLLAQKYKKNIPIIIQNIIKNLFENVPVANKNRGFKNLRWIKRFLSFASLNEYDRFLVSDLSLSKNLFESIYLTDIKYEDTYYYKYQKKFFENKSFSYLTSMCLNDTKIFLPEHNLTYSDKASMAAGVESRPPLIDHRIVEKMFTLPSDFRIRKHCQKWILKKVSEKYLPEKIIYRPKAPFGSPLRSWIRCPLKEMVNDLLSSESVKRNNIYNHKTINKLIENDRKGLEDNAHIIWTLLTNEIWSNIFIKN
jgi:asparagine synthase (glutamine-hydrolysing)